MHLSSALCRWLKVQPHLKNYHENLQLALEVSTFYQQADNTLFAINNMVTIFLHLFILLMFTVTLSHMKLYDTVLTYIRFV